MGGSVSSTRSPAVPTSGPSLRFRRTSTVNEPEVSLPGSGNAWQPNPDQFDTLESVQRALKEAGLLSSNLILGIDFTKSNTWTGKQSFGGANLHSISEDRKNPYETAVRAITETLSAFDDDQLIPCYGFGDMLTADRGVFSFLTGDKPCQGLDHVLSRYRELVPHVELAGPTSFAPIIYKAIETVKAHQGAFHILVIIADGQVTRTAGLAVTQFSKHEKETMAAIVDASEYPLSIVLVGVGDGPWDMMKHFDDNLPTRKFDNFQFVNFSSISMRHAVDPEKRNAVFAVSALMEVPEQFKYCSSQGIVNRGSFEDKKIRWSESVMDPPDAKKYANGQAQYSLMYCCPITKELMTDPVTAEDGFTYERSAIKAWLAKSNRSPMINRVMESKKLTPNEDLLDTILEVRAEMEQKASS